MKRMSPIQQSSYIGALRREDYNAVSWIMESGRRLDRSQISHIVDVLRNPPHISYADAGLHALARMGAEDGLPIIQEYIETESGDLEKYACVAKARLLAESNARNIAGDRQKATAKAEIFYKELNLTAVDLNNSLIAFHNPHLDTDADGRRKHRFSTLPPSPPIGVYAMRELADMVYNGSYNDYISLPEIAAVNFEDDYSSALKMRLASLPQDERLTVIISELANKKSLTPNDNYERQLAINEGKSASRLAAQTLLEMESRHDQYTSAGFSALFSVLSGVGDQEQSLILARFLYVTYPGVAHYAVLNHRHLLDGNRAECMTSY